jgi:hypothetical protein
MKILEQKTINISDSVFIKDETLIRFKGKDLFPEKTARAKEAFKSLKLPPR